MRIVVLDVGTLGDDLDLTPLSRAGEAVIHDFTSPEELAQRIVDAEVIVTNKHNARAQSLSELLPALNIALIKGVLY